MKKVNNILYLECSGRKIAEGQAPRDLVFVDRKFSLDKIDDGSGEILTMDEYGSIFPIDETYWTNEEKVEMLQHLIDKALILRDEYKKEMLVSKLAGLE